MKKTKLEKEIPEFGVLLKNVFSISFIRVFDYILPIIVIPYVVRIIGVENFGKISVAQSLVAYFSVIVSFGFNFSVTRLIALKKDNKSELENLFYDTLYAKIFLMFLSLLVLLGITLSVKNFREDFLLILFTSFTLIGETLFPIWFFQGIEKLDYVPKITIPTRVVFTAMIFVFIRKAQDFILVPLFYSLGPVVSGFIGFFYVLKFYEIKPIIPSFKRISFLIRESFLYFASRISITFYNSTNIILIKLILGDYYAGIYSASAKLLKVFRKMLQPFYISILPYFSKKGRLTSKKYLRANKLMFIGSTFMVLIVAIFVFFASELIIKIFFGKNFYESSLILKILIVSLPFYHMGAYIGAGFLVPAGDKKTFNYSVIFPSLFHLFMLAIIYASKIKNVYLIAFTVVFTQLVIFLIRSSRMLFREKD